MNHSRSARLTKRSLSQLPASSKKKTGGDNEVTATAAVHTEIIIEMSLIWSPQIKLAGGQQFIVSTLEFDTFAVVCKKLVSL